MKNKDLAGFTRDVGEETLLVPALQRVFNREVLENVTRDEIVEVLSTEVFLDIEKINLRLGGECLHDEMAINLLQIVEFFDIDYLMIVRRRLRKLGVTKYSLLVLFETICGDIEKHDLLSFVQEIAGDERFLFWYTKIEWIVPEIYDILYIFNLDVEILKSNSIENELIPAIVGDEVACSDMIIKFENFRNK
jgi:hypothetical protein